MQVWAKLLGDEVGTTPDIDDDAVFTKSRDSSAGNLGVRVFHGDDDPGDARIDDGVGARRGRPVVRAGFQGAVEGGATRIITSCLQCNHLGVTTSAPLCRTPIGAGLPVRMVERDDQCPHPRPR
jgi:hypothetical protein